MNMRILSTGASFIALAAVLSSCGSADTHEMYLLTTAAWNKYPGSAAEIGTSISVDFGWQDRTWDCFPLPSSLRVTVDGQEAKQDLSMGGDCLWDVLFEAGPFPSDRQGLTTVRVLDGEKLLGQATYNGLYPSLPAQLVNPADGRVPTAGTVDISLFSPLPADRHLADGGMYFWLDPPESVPPYYSLGRTSFADDRQSIAVTAPATTGRAALVVTVYNQFYSEAESCTGFKSCTGLPSDTLGPFYLEVIP
jgi:hypothetical protein